MPETRGLSLRSLLVLVWHASTQHLGGLATQAWLRTRLVDSSHLSADDFNTCFAVGRLTPGTNLLAFYTALGYVVARWRGALACVLVSTFAPATIAAVLGIVYVRYAALADVDRAMAGAQVGAVAVLAWTAAQLLTSTLSQNGTSRLRSTAIAVASLAALWVYALPPVLMLLLAAAAGAWLLRGEAT